MASCDANKVAAVAVWSPAPHPGLLPPARCRTVCTALSAICHIVTPELVGVFLPQASRWPWAWACVGSRA